MFNNYILTNRSLVDSKSEFNKNKSIDSLQETFEITRSLSQMGTPYDDAVTEVTYKIIMTNFASKVIFEILEYFKFQFVTNSKWFNNKVCIRVWINSSSLVSSTVILIKIINKRAT